MTIRKLYVVVFSILTILVLLPLPARAQIQGDGTIVVQLSNKTPNGKGVGEVSLELKTFVDGAEKGSQKSATDAQGKAQFSGLNTEPNYSYQVALNYQEADYTSNEISFKKDEKNTKLDVIVWDSTPDDKFINIGAAHFVVQFEGNELKITEYYRVDNTGDRTYIGSKVVPSLGKKETLRFNLSKGSQVHQLAMGLMENRIALENDALIDTMGVEPGGREIAFIYTTKFSSPNYTFPIVANRAIDNLNVVVEDRGFKVSSPQLSSPQSVKIENQPFIVLSKKDIRQGETIQATLSGLPGENPTNNLRLIGITLLGIAMLFGVSYAVVTKRKKPAPAEVSAPADRDQLLQEIANLDDAYEAGQLDKDEYLRQRSEKMTHLMDLSQ